MASLLPSSLVTRISLLVALTIVLAGLVSSLMGARYVEKSLENELIDRSKFIVSSLVETYTNDLINHNLIPVLDGIHRLVHESDDIAYIYFVDFDGKVPVHSFSNGFPVALLDAWLDVSEQHNTLHIANAVDGEKFIEQRRYLIDGLDARLHLGMTLTLVTEAVTKTRNRIFGIFIAIALLGGLIATFYARHLTRPLSYLSNMLEKFGQHKEVVLDDSQLTSGGSEIQSLALTVRQMLNERTEFEEDLSRAAIVFDNTQEGIFVTDQDGVILSVNRAFSEITGFNEQETVGETPDIFSANVQDSSSFKEFITRLANTDNWNGEALSRRKSGEVFPIRQSVSSVRDIAGRITHYICVFTDITDKKNSEERIHHLAHHDALTDLPNRNLLEERVEHALIRARRQNRQLTILFLDIDRFKQINDSLGHHLGDILLQEIANRLWESVREEDTVARLGGDEFILLFESIDTTDDVIGVTEKILSSISQPILIQGHELSVTTSIGISLYPRDGVNFQDLTQHADAAMYRAKEQGGNDFQFYTQELTDIARERLMLENSLRRALESGQLSLYYQPQVSLVTGKVIGFEALLRWEHPILGEISPAKFVPLAEETRLILPIGEWVLREACSQAVEWVRESVDFQCMAVNISGVQVESRKLVDLVREILEETGLAPEKLELEITESAILNDAKSAVEVMNRLAALGIYISMDDFGTGYSSLSYLKQMPIQKLKIDQSFVRDIPEDIGDAAIIRAVISMANSLQLQVIGEGVETEEQRQFLLDNGCQEAQGYLFSRPLPSDQIMSWIKTTYQSRSLGS